VKHLVSFLLFVFFSLKEEEKREREREDAIMPLPEGGVGGKECGGVVSEHRNGNGNVNGPVDQQTTPRSQARQAPSGGKSVRILVCDSASERCGSADDADYVVVAVKTSKQLLEQLDNGQCLRVRTQLQSDEADSDSQEGSNPDKEEENNGAALKLNGKNDANDANDRVTSNGGKLMSHQQTASAFQAFNSDRVGPNTLWKKRSVEGNATSNVIGPQHGNGSNGNGSNGNGSNGNGSNGNGHESNGASSRRIMPKIQQPRGGVKKQKLETRSPHHILQQDSNMTLTPFGPMPSHLAQSVFWGMAAQQEYLTAMQYQQVPAAVNANANCHQDNKKQSKKAKSEVEEEMNLPTASTQTQQKLNGSVSQISQEKTTTTTSNSKKETAAERRAAALDKYRQKRKTLCFSKKIRYASRKQLAEARPRNKGQFVRCNNASPSPESGSASGSASVSAGNSQGNGEAKEGNIAAA